MNVTWHYPAGPDLSRWLAGLHHRGLSVTVCEPADRGRFRELLPGTEAIWHLL